MTGGAREWYCKRCNAVYVSPLPIVAIRCECSKRSGKRDYWMTPKEGTK